MSESAYETNRLRCRAVIRIGLGTSRELGKYLLPDQEEHQAQIRANEWLRGSQPRSVDVFLRWKEWTDARWELKDFQKELEKALRQEIRDQKTKGK